MMLKREMEQLRIENASLMEDKANMAKTIADGTLYLQNTLKEMAKLHTVIGELTTVGAQAVLQMRMGSMHNALTLPVAAATPKSKPGRIAIAKAVYISKSSSGKGALSSSTGGAERQNSIAGAKLTRTSSSSSAAGVRKSSDSSMALENASKKKSSKNGLPVKCASLQVKEQLVQSSSPSSAVIPKLLKKSPTQTILPSDRQPTVTQGEGSSSNELVPGVPQAATGILDARKIVLEPGSTCAPGVDVIQQENATAACADAISKRADDIGQATIKEASLKRSDDVAQAASKRTGISGFVRKPASAVLTYSPPKARPVGVRSESLSAPTTTGKVQQALSEVLGAPGLETSTTVEANCTVSSSFYLTPGIAPSKNQSQLVSLREFIAQRRNASKQAKPSASFASVVPRFEKKQELTKEAT
jgi:hypothetical protein